jgi:hypothetical protein
MAVPWSPVKDTHRLASGFAYLFVSRILMEKETGDKKKTGCGPIVRDRPPSFNTVPLAA